MFNILLSYNPLIVRLIMAALALVLVIAYLVFRARQAVKSGASAPASILKSSTPSPSLFATSFGSDSPILNVLGRGLLIVLAVYVAASLVLISLPDGSIDRMALSLRLRNPEPPPQERIALLYLADEMKEKEFNIKGVIRNISTQPIEKLDATIRLYRPDGILTETAVVRMDAEIVAPDALSSFHLAFPESAGPVGSYAVDFKLRLGQAMPYKDMRGSHTGN